MTSAILDAVAWRIADANEAGETAALPRLIAWGDLIAGYSWTDHADWPAYGLLNRPRVRTAVVGRYETPRWVRGADPHRLRTSGTGDERAERVRWHEVRIRTTEHAAATVLGARSACPVPLTADETDGILSRAFAVTDHHHAVAAANREGSR